ncbi:MAG TPA: hypothetical protein VIW24_32580 [Aldersonia sp.]
MGAEQDMLDHVGMGQAGQYDLAAGAEFGRCAVLVGAGVDEFVDHRAVHVGSDPERMPAGE